MKRLLLIGLAACLALTACATTQWYYHPRSDLPSVFRAYGGPFQTWQECESARIKAADADEYQCERVETDTRNYDEGFTLIRNMIEILK